MPRRQGGSLSGFTPLSTPNAPTDLSVSTSIGSATVSFTAPSDTGDAAVTSYIVTAVDESTGESTGATGSSSPISISPGGGTFKIRAQAVNGFGPGRLTEFDTGNVIYSGAELYAWGYQSVASTPLGDNTTASRSSPVQIGALSTWMQTSAGDHHSAAIKTDGTLWTWGGRNLGGLGLLAQTGDNTNVYRSSPIQIGALTTWASIGAGSNHTLAVLNSGALYAWGFNSNGQLGDNTTTNKSSPVQIGALTNWLQTSGGSNHSHAVKTDNTLWGWGLNTSGQIGDGTTTQRNSPIQVGLLTNWIFVSDGATNSNAIKTDGTLWSWGANSLGEVGDGTTTQRNSPVQIGALTNWATVSRGNGSNALAVKTDGTLWAWGYNGQGRLGTNQTGFATSKSSPVQIGALTNWLYVAAGYNFGIAAKTDGTLWSWGNGNHGVLGQNNTISRSSPVQVGALTSWLRPSAGNLHTLALLGVL